MSCMILYQIMIHIYPRPKPVKRSFSCITKFNFCIYHSNGLKLTKLKILAVFWPKFLRSENYYECARIFCDFTAIFCQWISIWMRKVKTHIFSATYIYYTPPILPQMHPFMPDVSSSMSESYMGPIFRTTLCQNSHQS